MEDLFVPYELALELKKLGFDEPCLAYWDNEKVFELNPEYLRSSQMDSTWVTAPLYQQVFRWFREKYILQCNIVWNKFYSNTPYQWEVRKQWIDELMIPYGYGGMTTTYEETELACLKKLIEIVKENGKTIE